MDQINGTVTEMSGGYGFHFISQMFLDNGSDLLVSVSTPDYSTSYLDNIPYDDPGQTPDSNRSAQSDNKLSEDLLEFADINSDVPLNFISKILLEEDMEDQIYIHPGELLATERPFYDILHDPSPDQPPLYSDCSLESPDSGSSGQFHNSQDEAAAFVADLLVDDGWHHEFGEHLASEAHTIGIVDYLSASVSNKNDRDVVVCELEDYLLHSTLPVSDEGQYIGQFNKGVDEARKFLPDTSKLSVNITFDGILPPETPDDEITETKVKVEEAEEEPAGYECRGKKNQNLGDLDSEEGRSKKQIAVAPDRTIRSELLDSMLLCSDEPICESTASTCTTETSQTGGNDNAKNGPTKKGSNTGRSKGKKQGGNKVIDLRSIMIQCAQSVAVDDRRSANEQLKQIRQHSSPIGDGSQRLVHYFADGLEARLAGTGSQIYRTLRAKKATSSADILKACRLYMGSCPFKILSFFFANQTILKMSQNASRVHIIDYGIGFGFQWPCLIQRFSMREEGPPKLRITGIDFPQPGFRPTERLEETGLRLSDYADSFGVPFQYCPVASSNWEKIKAEDLQIEEDELVFVNTLFQFRNLADETVDVACPRNIVLSNIKKMNPAAFLLGVYNGAYGAPFFMTRFREAFFHFSALFDMLDCIATRDNPERELLEREFFGLEAMNVIACEGSERVHRPETYKQWQVRNLRAGFSQLAPDPAFVKFAKFKANTGSNKDFIVDEDKKWLLLGWKGRVTHAISKWKPSSFAV